MKPLCASLGDFGGRVAASNELRTAGGRRERRGEYGAPVSLVSEPPRGRGGEGGGEKRNEWIGEVIVICFYLAVRAIVEVLDLAARIE